MSRKKNKVNKELPDNREKYNLKGNVWQVKQTWYSAVVKKNGLIECSQDKYRFRGNSLYTFNEPGNVAEKAYYDFDDGIYVDTYNEQGEHLVTTHYDENGSLKAIHRREYHSSGEIAKILQYDKDNNLTYTTVWEHDDEGNCIEFYTLYPDGMKKGRQIFVNDSEGRKTDQTMYDSEGKFSRRMQYKYNEHGHTIETKYLYEDGTVEKTEKTDLTYGANGKLTMINGRKIERDENMETSRFEYDSHANWIRKIEFYKDVPTAVAVRELNYFGKEAKGKFELGIIPLTGFFMLQEDDGQDKKNRDKRSKRPEPVWDVALTDAERQWVGEASKPGDFNAKRFYIARFKEIPSEIQMDDASVEVMALREMLKKNVKAVELFSSKPEFTHYDGQLDSYALGFAGKPYILHVTNISGMKKSGYDASKVVKKFDGSSSYYFTGPMALYIPAPGSGKGDINFEYELQSYFELCTLDPVPDTPQIYMVEVANNTFQLHSHPVNDNFEIKELNINYGSGFDTFHGELMERFDSETQGLVLFHGEPGTGKTFYIRHLLRKMAGKKKKVIYMPPNMVDHLVDPVFMTFLTRTISQFSRTGIFCVLLIEDAEPLLASRSSDTRIQGVTNLLNMTDGLLNDMLRLQIICTFNVDLKKIDRALLRPGRLIARKEFKPLSTLDANLLTQRLGIKHHFTSPATLGEIYALRSNKSTLIHDVETDKGSSTFIDDLI